MLQAHDRLAELGLPVALHPGDADDLTGCGPRARRRRRRHVPAAFSTRRPFTSRIDLARTGRFLVHLQLDRAPDHEGGQLLVGRARWRRADDPPAADDSDPVGDLLDLFQLVADEDDRLARGLELAHDAEELVGLARGEDGGRLVQDHDARLAVEGLDDLDPLLDPDRQVLHEGVGVDGEAVAGRELEHVLAGAASVRADRARSCAPRRA